MEVTGGGGDGGQGRVGQLYRTSQPLEIPSILHQILGYLPYHDLQKARLVSHQFDEEACRGLRKRSKIVLNSPKRFIAFNLEMWKSLEEHRYCDHFQLINAHVCTPAVTMFTDKLGKFIRSFELKDSKWSCPQLTTILTETMTNLEELVLHGVIPKDTPRLFIRDSEEGREHLEDGVDVDPFLPKLPNIKRLDLQLYDKQTDDEALSQFGVDLLRSATNLEELRSHDTGKWRSKRERFLRILFEILIKPELNIVLSKLKKVGFPLSPWNDEQIQRLTAKRFPLQYLNLTILPDISTTALTALLISLKNTLKKLKLSFTSWRVMDFPCDMNLNKLQYLSLDWFNGSITFISKFTDLRTLILAQADLNEIFTDEETAKFQEPLKNVSQVEVYQHSGPSVYPTAVKNLAKVFPKVKGLVIGKLNDDSLRQVFERYPQLESFSAIEGAFTDFGVTGIDAILCDVCKKEHLPELCKGYYNENLVNLRRTRRFIGDLKNVQKITLKSPHITNLSVIHGVVLCRRLKSLSLWSYEMNFRSLKRIVETFNLDYLESTHTFSHIAEIRYALNRMMGKQFILNGIVAPTFASQLSQETREFLSQFHDNVCRSIISHMKQRSSPPYDHDLTVYHNTRHQNHHSLFFIYDVCMADALQGLLGLNSGI